MQYSVKHIAKIGGVTVRTLHYYDQIDLLKPVGIKENGYRFYDDKSVAKLVQILFFKELDFSIEKIKHILSDKNFDIKKALNDQKKFLELKKERIEKLIERVNENVIDKEGGVKGMNDDVIKPFKDDKLTEYMDEAKQRWGNTDAYKQSMQKVKNWTKKDYEEIKKKGEEFTKTLASHMGEDVKTEAVQELIKKHYEGIQYFYNCSLDMYKMLGQMYVDDPRFTAYYDKHKKGLAKWLNEGIKHYCEVNQ